MSKLEIAYPAKNFSKIARSAMDKDQPWQVTITSPWRLRLIRKSIEFWPRSHDDIERLKGAKKHSFVLATYLLFSLFHVHIRAMTSNYQMSYLVTEDSLKMDYATK
jgi:hypothetical protein